MKTYKVLDLFAGGGGFSSGLLKANYQDCRFIIKKANDIDDDACKTLENHLGAKKVIRGDITNPKIKNQLIKECRDVDVIVGGPPCQTFSLVGPARSGKKEIRDALKNDPRNILYKHFFEVVEAIQPRFIVFENVEGLLSKNIDEQETVKEKRVIEAICDDLESIGYETKVSGGYSNFRIMNSADYGVPQQRKRVVIIANRHGLANIYPSTTHGISTKRFQTLNDTILEIPIVLPKINNSNIKKLKNIHVVIENLEICIGAFVENLNMIAKNYSFRQEIQTKEFNNLIIFVNQFYKQKIVKRRNYKYKVLNEFIKGYNERMDDINQCQITLMSPSHECRKHNIRDLVIFSLMKPGSNSSQFINEESNYYYSLLNDLYPYDKTKHKDTYVKHSFDKLSNTILAHMQKDGLKFIHPEQPRTFTPYEASLIQSFPKDYKFYGGRNSQYRQIGNAVPPLMAKKIGQSILQQLHDFDMNKDL